MVIMPIPIHGLQVEVTVRPQPILLLIHTRLLFPKIMSAAQSPELLPSLTRQPLPLLWLPIIQVAIRLMALPLLLPAEVQVQILTSGILQLKQQILPTVCWLAGITLLLPIQIFVR